MADSPFHSYSPKFFQALPSVEAAAERFARSGGLSTVWPALQTIARKHPSSRDFGVQLLHRHASLRADEVMLAHGDITFPVKVSDLSADGIARVRATIWGILPGTCELVPLEYAVDATTSTISPAHPDPALARDFVNILQSFGLDESLGLAWIGPRQDKVLESTFGRANVIRPLALLNSSYTSVEVTWRLPSAAADERATAKQECVQVCENVHSPITAFSFTNMTAFVLSQYCPALFQALPPVEVAASDFKSFGGFDKVERALAAVAEKHPSQAPYFGMQLLHRHSDLDADEVMVTYGAATFPIKRADLSAHSMQLRATVWGLRPGSEDFAPLEFAVDDQHGDGTAHLDTNLAQDIARVLRAFGLHRMLGLAAVRPGQGVVLETTYGRANIVMPIDLQLKPASAVQVLWPLSSLGTKSLRDCLTYCRTDDEGKHVAWGHIRV
ncbi:hypothetical protein OC842_006098 [Tilletia horrida]|uniref:Uncharacterized protein n=1 Tax=Tilletia horrida TaxID=155126 RepID=A0AAN6JIB3_9BASI|nr:hypothetical protein OC842_006098 [Tilletia horrida]